MTATYDQAKEHLGMGRDGWSEGRPILGIDRLDRIKRIQDNNADYRKKHSNEGNHSENPQKVPK